MSEHLLQVGVQARPSFVRVCPSFLALDNFKTERVVESDTTGTYGGKIAPNDTAAPTPRRGLEDRFFKRPSCVQVWTQFRVCARKRIYRTQKFLF